MNGSYDKTKRLKETESNSWSYQQKHTWMNRLLYNNKQHTHTQPLVFSHPSWLISHSVCWLGSHWPCQANRAAHCPHCTSVGSNICSLTSAVSSPHSSAQWDGTIGETEDTETHTHTSADGCLLNVIMRPCTDEEECCISARNPNRADSAAAIRHPDSVWAAAGYCYYNHERFEDMWRADLSCHICKRKAKDIS